jgi:hypothetical protein
MLTGSYGCCCVWLLQVRLLAAALLVMLLEGPAAKTMTHACPCFKRY